MAKENRVTTPKVTAQWAQPFTANQYGNLSIVLLFDPKDPTHKAQLDAFEAKWKDEYDHACLVARKKSLKCDNKLWRPQTDENGAETGFIEVRLKQKAVVTTKDDRVLNFSVKVVGPDPSIAWDRDVKIGNGSIVRAGFDWNPHTGGPQAEFGLGARWKSLQVIDLVAYDDGFGFEVEEGSVVEELELVGDDYKALGVDATDAVNRGDGDLPF